MVDEYKWKEAVKDLDNFSKMMDLVRRYPIKEPFKKVECSPYNIENSQSIQYEGSSFWN